MKKFWRRVWTYDFGLQRWKIVVDTSIKTWSAFTCEFGVGWCNLPQPYVYEQWWELIPDTIGSGYGSWSYLGGRINWGANPVVE